ncbi:hypothetical protein SAMN05421784_1671, partial [Xenorhabdus koppenhoeferi]
LFNNLIRQSVWALAGLYLTPKGEKDNQVLKSEQQLIHYE